MVTLWPVQDRVAAVVMERSYAHLAGDGNVSHALAQAQREVSAWDAARLAADYGRLPGAEPGNAAPMRDAAVSSAAAPDLAHGWAAFAHIGT